MTRSNQREKVVYLFGAGASHACVKAVGSAYGILMRDLGDELAGAVQQVVEATHGSDRSLETLVNDVIDENTDFEHVITFLDESPSGLHKDFAQDLRDAFETVLRGRLAKIESEQGRVPDDLYFVLLDMHRVVDLPEELSGILTLNYDCYLENAIRRSSGRSLDPGISLSWEKSASGATKLLKLHGSFDWDQTWPVTKSSGDDTLWIPPGIQKAKEQYPFNMLWGRARELLDCDVLRVVGCRLGPNDWDLISLLFATRHTNKNRSPYRVELIDSPKAALRLQSEHPYLGVKSILEVEPIGSYLVAEFTGGSPREYATLGTAEQSDVIEQAGTSRNWFRLWLKHKAEAILRDVGSVSTDEGALESFLEEE